MKNKFILIRFKNIYNIHTNFYVSLININRFICNETIRFFVIPYFLFITFH